MTWQNVIFAARGAKKVIEIVIKPAPSPLEFALENIKLNKLNHIVELRKEAGDNVDDKQPYILKQNTKANPPLTLLKLKRQCSMLRRLHFPVFMKEVGQCRPVKINCEGAEHKILRQSFPKN